MTVTREVAAVTSSSTPVLPASEDARAKTPLCAVTACTMAPLVTREGHFVRGGDVFGGRYEIVRELDRGAMGVVYEAADRSLGRRVALKTMAGDLRTDPTAVQRFLREARAAAAVHHRNVVLVHDHGTADGTPFLTMQLVGGTGLHRLLAGGAAAADTGRRGGRAAGGTAWTPCTPAGSCTAT